MINFLLFITLLLLIDGITKKDVIINYESFDCYNTS